MVVSAFTFWKSFSRLKESEQIKLAHDVGTDLLNAENQLLDSLRPESSDKAEIRVRCIQYLNVCEWFAFLINNNKITDPLIEDHFKPSMMEEYDTIFSLFPDIRDDKEKFKEFKLLYKKWKEHSAKNIKNSA